MVSWRNPHKAHSHWGMENYIQALIEASDTMMRITRQKQFNICVACSGGISVATFLSALASRNDARVNSFTLQVCVLDSKRSDSDIGLFLTDRAIEIARRKIRKSELLYGKELARSFAWMRPNDLICVDMSGGTGAQIIGTVQESTGQTSTRQKKSGRVILETHIGGNRILDELEDDPLPRIC